MEFFEYQELVVSKIEYSMISLIEKIIFHMEGMEIKNQFFFSLARS